MSAHQKVDSAAVLRKLATIRAEAKEVRDGIRPVHDRYSVRQKTH
jgi:hypothetical protein